MSTKESTPTLTAQERVWRAADELTAAGERPTARAVRQRASIDAAVVQEHLPTWKAEQEAAAADAAAAPPVPAEARGAFDRLWTATWSTAEAHFRPLLDEAEEQIKQLKRHLAQLDAEATEAEAELAEARETAEKAQASAQAAVAAQAAAEAQAITEEKARRRAEGRAAEAEAALRAALEAAAQTTPPAQ